VETAYSNNGAMWAGYIVQLVSDKPFESNIEEHIFKPLGINCSTCRQPVPGELEKALAKSYSYVSNNFTEWPHFKFVQGAPAAGMSSPASDMAKFLIAQLSLDCRGILKEETVKKFHSTLFRSDPE
jgi:CubicO group peptidase (beta-lactamase class C family)